MVRFKPLPEPRPLDELRRIHGAVPADPTATDDCCSSLQAAASLPNRETAREWLGFLEALELVDDDGGYYRRDWPADKQELGKRFEQRILGARELLATVQAEGPVTRDELLWTLDDSDAMSGRSDDRTLDSLTRVERLLGWSDQLGLVSERDGRYSRSYWWL